VTNDPKLKSFLQTDVLKLPRTVYHYTSFDGFKGIARDEKIWASHSDYLNDSSEARHLLSVISKNVKDWKLSGNEDYRSAQKQLLSFIKSPLATQYYIASFSEVGDALSQWRAYCKRGGVSIGFSAESLLKARTEHQLDGTIPGIDLNVCKVRYIGDGRFSEATEDLLEFFSIWQDEAENPEQRTILFENTLSSLVCYYKHIGFEEEREWRLVVSDESHSPDLQYDIRTSSSMLIPYIPVVLLGDAPQRMLDQIITEVIVGPGPHMELNERAIRMYFALIGMSHIPVLCSSIPYRDW
jgi:hypothetical protein